MAAIQGTGTIHEIECLDDFKNYRDHSGDVLVVVDFYADWCGPCKAISPAFKELAKEHRDVCFIQVSVDDQEDVAAECSVECMPTFHFYKKGKLLKSFSGANKDTLISAVKEFKKKDVK
ncbi:thioredoxin-like [Acanthaster planci]|uniref:Thioredoxin-like n=1 Tax=Acanthaster planci TaxID=133434 RepID=A0A8B7Z7J4_ACAPL|nr:thioredoxin-like [Acanthaster planci]